MSVPQLDPPPAAFERRRWRRVNLDLEASLRVDGSARKIPTRVQNGCVGGIFLVMARPPEEGTRVRINVLLPAPAEVVTLHALVARRERGAKGTNGEAGVGFLLTVPEARWSEFCQALEELP